MLKNLKFTFVKASLYSQLVYNLCNYPCVLQFLIHRYSIISDCIVHLSQWIQTVYTCLFVNVYEYPNVIYVSNDVFTMIITKNLLLFQIPSKYFLYNMFLALD